MTYEDLKSQYDGYIPYQSLLSCNEWLDRRKQILKRDKYYCRDCGVSSSIFHDNFTLNFQKGTNLNLDRVVYSKTQLPQFKASFTTGDIKVYKHPELGFIYGLSTNYIVFAMNQASLNTPRKELVINYYPDHLSGRIIPVVDTQNGSEHPIPLPITNPTRQKVPLQVHHNYYVHRRLPWEYEDEALVSLCAVCHHRFHEENQVKIFTQKGNELIELNYTPCRRCNGLGYFDQFSKVQGGICFRCHGARFEELIQSRIG